MKNKSFCMCHSNIAVGSLSLYFACGGVARAFLPGARDAPLSRGFPERRRFQPIREANRHVCRSVWAEVRLCWMSLSPVLSYRYNIQSEWTGACQEDACSVGPHQHLNEWGEFMETVHVHRFTAAQLGTNHMKESKKVPWQRLYWTNSVTRDCGLLFIEMDCIT